MAESLVPQALARMHSVVVGALPKLNVYMGGPTGGDVPAKYAAVGYAGDDRAGVNGTRDRNPTGVGYREQFSIWCAASTASGDQNAARQMQDTDAIFQTMSAALAADRNLGGLLAPPGHADLGSFEWTIEQGGEIATVFFEVVVYVAFGG